MGGLSVHVSGSVREVDASCELHLRLWKVPFFWKEREVASLLQEGIVGLQHVKVTLFRDIRTSVKARRHDVGGYTKVHCAGTALAVGRAAVDTALQFTVRTQDMSLHGTFTAEVSTQEEVPFSSPQTPVPTLACCAYTVAQSQLRQLGVEVLLELIASAVPSARDLISMICLGARPAKHSLPRGVHATMYMLECRDGDTALAVQNFLHDSRTHPAPVGGLAAAPVLHTAEFTKGKAGSTVYKALFVPQRLHRLEQSLWPAYVHEKRQESLHVTQTLLQGATDRLLVGEVPVIPPFIMDLIIHAASLAAGALQEEDSTYALMGAVACATYLGHIG